MPDPEKYPAISAELVRRAAAVDNDQSTPADKRWRLLAEIAELGKRARDGGIPREDWENHELNWIVYCAKLRKNLVSALAQAMMQAEKASESEEREMSEEMRQALYWWQNEGGREEFLGELPIDERRVLESGGVNR